MRASARWLGLLVVATMPAVQAATPAKDYRSGYAKLAKLPDWSGVWAPDWGTLFPRNATPPAPPAYTPAAKKTVDEYKASQARGENTQTDAANCIPVGMPSIMRMPYPIEFVFSPERVTIITETDHQVRRVYTDGRPMPQDPDPTFNGTSIGHWEGDTLVVETIALNPKNSLGNGLKATENTKIVERIHNVDPDHILIETSITDPALFTAPLTSRQGYARKKDWEIREYVCEENNKDSADEFGRPSMSIN